MCVCVCDRHTEKTASERASRNASQNSPEENGASTSCRFSIASPKLLFSKQVLQYVQPRTSLGGFHTSQRLRAKLQQSKRSSERYVSEIGAFFYSLGARVCVYVCGGIAELTRRFLSFLAGVKSFYRDRDSDVKKQKKKRNKQTNKSGSSTAPNRTETCVCVYKLC